MKETFETEEVMCTSRQQIAEVIRDGLDLLEAQTSATVTYEDTGSSVTVDALVNAGHGAYFRVYTYVENLVQKMQLSSGYLQDGEFVAVSTQSVNEFRLTGYNPFFCDLIVINGGAFWDWGLNCDVVSPNISEIRMRTVELRSSILDSAWRTVGVYTGGARNISFPNWSYDYIILEGGSVRSVDHGSITNLRYNVPADTQMLIPALISFINYVPLGVPTVGDEPTYAMGNRWNAMNEFTLNGAWYVSLGYVAIRSPRE